MAWLGDFALGATFDTKFCTVQATGAPTTLAGSPVISAYPDNSTTQLTAGITLSVDFDSVTGLNNVRVVATGANGYLAGSNYQLVITTGTVNSVSAVGYVVGEFSIQARPPQISATGATQAVGVADAGTLQSATGTTAVLRSGASATDSIYNGHTLFIASGTGAGESRLITGYVGASKTATVDTWTTTPDNTSLYVVIATPPASTASLLPVDVKAINAVSTSPVTTVKAVQGIAVDGQITTVTGNVNGSVGSVSGAVGSVTGNVGGNVVGSVASVTAGVTVTTNNDKTGYRLDATGSAALTETYAPKGAAGTLPQLLYSTLQALTEFSTSGTTVTVKKRDQSTTAFTETLDSSSAPTSITQAT